MAILTGVLAGLALLLALPLGGLYLWIAGAAWSSPAGRGLGCALGLIALLDLGCAMGAALAAWGGWDPGLWLALGSLALSGLLARVAAGIAHGVANP